MAGKYKPEIIIKSIESDEIIIHTFNLVFNISDNQANTSLNDPLNIPASDINNITVPCVIDNSLNIPTETPIRANPALILRNINNHDCIKYRSLIRLRNEKLLIEFIALITAYFGFLKRILPNIITGKYIAAKQRNIY